ncbi:MAG: L-aspartate oxidase [Planctomycetes bacterium]|nr:L-aspartate oxidase [Planctomycetota bacterium]
MEQAYVERRYLVSFETRRMGHIFTDVLVIGGGAGGLRAAIEASRYGQTLMIVKGAAEDSNSAYAQGGVAAVLDEADSIDEHIHDTLVAGADLCDETAVREVAANAAGQIHELVGWGADFDRSGGRLDLTREGGHGQRRIVHAHGDATGIEIVRTLWRLASSREGLKIFDHCFVIDLITDPPDGGDGATVLGAMTWHERFGPQMIWARQTILATGGAGVLWRETTNPPVATADGHAMAFRAGAALADMEMMQFHPTTLYIAGASRSLISEAVRGEGAYLVDRNGERFMPNYHSDAELAPRDVVSRAILRQIAATGGGVFLDVRHLGAERFAQRFPGIYEQCRKFEIDPATDRIPVRPAAHYMIGGVRTDLEGRTNLRNLLACGECANTGLHGANRLGSNSLIEALVLGHRCGRLAGEASRGSNGKLAIPDMKYAFESVRRTELDLSDIRNSLRAIMWRNVGVARAGQTLEETIEIVNFWGRYVLDKGFFHPDGWQLQNMLTVARLVAELARRRTESRGVHYRTDCPDADPAWRRHQTVRVADRQLVVDSIPTT